MEDWCGYLVVAAVVLEGLIYVVPFVVSIDPHLVDLGEFIASGLVALGVYGEIRFSRIVAGVLKDQLVATTKDAREAHTQSMQAMHHLALANEKAARLQKEAEEAKERTAEIELMLAKFKKEIAGRSLTIEQTLTIAEAVREKGLPGVSVQSIPNDNEGYVFAQDIVAALGQGGVEAKWSNMSFIHFLTPDPDFSGILVLGYGTQGAAWGATIRDAFKDAGIATDEEEKPQIEAVTASVAIIVGQRPSRRVA